MEGSALGVVCAVMLMLIFQLGGLCAAKLFLPRESGGARLLLGSVLGSVMLHWLPVVFAFFLGFGMAAHVCAVAVVLVLSVVCLRLCTERGRKGFSGALSAFGRSKFLWLIAAMCLFFGFLVWKSFLFKDGRVYSSQATYGDMSMHLSFITSLAKQGAFPPDYSLLPNFRLSYPFLSDSISSSLYICGAPLKTAYFLPMLLAGAQVFFGFYLFVSRLLESRKKAAVAWMLFFFCGGLGFVYFLNGERTFSQLFYGFYQTPTNLTEKNIRWVNVVVDMMLPQRATLFGWAILFAFLYLLYRAVFEGERGYFLISGILAGLLPMVHTHSFLAAALVCAAWLMCDMFAKDSLGHIACKITKFLLCIILLMMTVLCAIISSADSNVFLMSACALATVCIALLVWLITKNIRQSGWRDIALTWGVLFVSACVFALPQLFYWTFRQVGENGMLRGHFGWVITDGADSYPLFCLKNVGLAAILGIGGLFSAKSRELAKYSPALLIWLLAELVEFQPNNYDNNKLLYIAFAFLCCAAAEFFSKLLRNIKSRPLKFSAATVALTICTVSAVLTMARESIAQYELFGTGAVALADFVEEDTAPDAIVLTDTRHNNEIAALSGRNIVCGSSSYLFYHGLPYHRYEQIAREIYEYPHGSENYISELEIDYILVSDFERSAYSVNETEIAALYTKIYDDGVRALYKVTKGGRLQ